VAVRVLVQRVSTASVAIDGQVVGSIGAGLLLFVGFTHSDEPPVLDWMADKITGLRVFADDDGKMNRALSESGGAVLIVSQFTLYGNAAKGSRPSFIDAAKPDQAIPLYERFVELLRDRKLHVETGRFGAHMNVSLVNDGPVTLMLDR
jgi:D-tyrosyl-tRNA(Tyr) deacylase